MIIRGERVEETAILTPTRELFISQKNGQKVSDFIAEETRRWFFKGQDSGEKIGYEKALQESKPLFSLLQTLSEKLLEQRKNLLEQIKPELIDIALAICEKVIRNELREPEGLIQLINAVLEESRTQLKSTFVQIYLAPEDLEMIEEHLSQIHYNKQRIQDLRFDADPLMQRGDCRIETQSELLNYAVARELADLKMQILEG